MEELGKIPNGKDVSTETRAEIIHTLVFPVTMYGCESWTVKKVDKEKT